MKKISLHVDGMKCGMCESHVNDAVRKAADVKKVRSSLVSGLTEIICDDNTDVDKIVSAGLYLIINILRYSVRAYDKCRAVWCIARPPDDGDTLSFKIAYHLRIMYNRTQRCDPFTL